MSNVILKVRNGSGVFVEIPAIVGPRGHPGPAGDPGMPGANGNPGPGVPAGGETGQLLLKSGGGDYDTQWKAPAEIGLATTDYVDNAIGGAIGRGY